jgi:hypothetical protein
MRFGWDVYWPQPTPYVTAPLSVYDHLFSVGCGNPAVRLLDNMRAGAKLGHSAPRERCSAAE